jgi:hypothetical protein
MVDSELHRYTKRTQGTKKETTEHAFARAGEETSASAPPVGRNGRRRRPPSFNMGLTEHSLE